VLQELVQPHFLRRDKMTVFGMGKQPGADAANDDSSSSSSTNAPSASSTAPVHALQLTATKREWTVSESAAASLRNKCNGM
jgi:hypothetical protein